LDNFIGLGFFWGILTLGLVLVFFLGKRKRTGRQVRQWKKCPDLNCNFQNLRRIKGPLPASLLNTFRQSGIIHMKEIASFWDDLSPEIKSQIREFWESEGFLNQCIQELGAKSEPERVAAAEVLIKIKDPQTIAPLIKALGEPTKYLPARVAEVIIAFGGDAVEEMISCLADLPDEAKCMAISVLEEIGDQRALGTIMNQLTSDSFQVRKTAAAALGEMGSMEAEEMLISLLQDPNWQVKSSAAKALGKLGSLKAVPFLAKALTDDAWWVRANAQEALAVIKGVRKDV